MSNGAPLAGDPFSMAYGRPQQRVSPHGPFAQQQRAKQELDAARSQAQERNEAARNQYAGYGFKVPGPECPPSPTQAIYECIQAFQQVLGETFQLADLAPWIHPTFRANFTCKSAQAVIGPDAATDPAANAVANLLASAASGPGFTVPVLEVSAANQFVTLFTVSPQQGEMARVKSWGIDSGNAGDKAIAMSLKGDRRPGFQRASRPVHFGAGCRGAAGRVRAGPGRRRPRDPGRAA